MRIPEDLWEQFEAARQRAGAKDRSEVVRDFIRWYVREAGAKMPKRPAEDGEQQG